MFYTFETTISALITWKSVILLFSCHLCHKIPHYICKKCLIKETFQTQKKLWEAFEK